MCARRGSPRSARRAGVSLQPGLLPPAPLPRAPVPPSFPARPSPAGQALGRPGGAGGGGSSELGSPGLRAALGAGAEPPPPPSGRAGPASLRATPCQNFVAAAAGAASGAGRRTGGREGGAGAGPGRARAARGSESGGPGPRPHHAPARRRRRRRLGRRQRRLGRRGSRRRGRPRGQRRADPLPGRGRRGAGAEQRQRVGAAGPGRSQVVPGQRVGEPEQQLGLGGEEAPAADPRDPGPAPAHPPSPLCLLRRRRGARSPPGTLSRSHGTISPKVRAGPGCPPLLAPLRLAPRLGSPSVPLAPVAVPLIFAPVGLSRPGARVGGAWIPGPRPGTPYRGAVPRAPASPPPWFYRQ